MENLPGNACSIPGLGRSPGREHGNPLQYSCLENPMDREAWRPTVHSVAKSQTWQKGVNTAHTYTLSEASIKPCLPNWLFMLLPSLLSIHQGHSAGPGMGQYWIQTLPLRTTIPVGPHRCSRRNNRFGWGAGWDHIYLRSFQMKTSICTYCISPPNLITFLSCCKSAFPSANLLLKPGWNW